jgi:hypothetical protein
VTPLLELESRERRARPAGLRRRCSPEAAVLAAGLLSAAMLLGALAAPLAAGRVFTADDLAAYHLPARAFYAEQLARGEAFDWMPGLYNGFYLTGEGQVGGYHPWHWGLYTVLPLGVAFQLEIVGSYLALLAGTYLWLRGHLPGRGAALAGGVLSAGSGFCLLHLVHPNAVAVVAHVPWLLWLCDAALRREAKWRPLAETGVALAVASQLLLGYPQYVWLSLLVWVPYAVWQVRQLGSGRGAVARLAAMAVCGGLVAGVQLVPTIDALTQSTRSEFDVALANSGSLHPLNLVQVVAPYLFSTRVVGQNTHELGLYAGAVPAALCAWLWGERRRLGRLRGLALAAAALGAGGLWLACGEHLGAAQVGHWVPGVNRFRFSCRAIFLVHLAAAILAAVAVTHLVRAAERGMAWGRSNGPLAALVAAAVVAAAAGPVAWPDYAAGWALVWSGPALVWAAAALVRRAARGQGMAVAGLVVLAAVDLGVYGLSYSAWGKIASPEELAARAPRPPEPAARVLAPPTEQGARVGNGMLLAGVRRADGYAGLEPRQRLDYALPSAQRLAGVGWVWEADANGRRQWRRVNDPLPRVRLVSAAVRQATDQVVPESIAVVEEDVALGGGTPGVARLMNDRPGRVTIDTEAPARQLLVVAESFHEGWQARVNGRDAPVVRVNGDFLGCVVGPGRETVELVFRPVSRRVGGWLSGCGLGLLVCGLLYRTSRKGLGHGQ